MTDTNKMRKLLAAATPPPWYGTWSISTADGDPIASTDVSLASDPEESDANGDLIVAAVNALPALLDELDAARNKIRADEEHLPTIGRLTQDLYETEQELDAARAEVEQIKADRDSLLRIIGDSFMNLHIPHSAMAFDGRNLTPHAEESARASEIYRTERDAARAEEERLRGMLALLCAAVEHSAPRYGVDEDWADIDTLHERMDEAKALLAKHKETDQ